MLMKCKINREDPYIGLLNIRNIPQEKEEQFPIEKMIGHKTRSTIPRLSKTTYEELDKDHIIEEDTKRADLRPLSVVQMVRLQSLREESYLERRTNNTEINVNIIKKKDRTTVRLNRLFMKPSTGATYHLIEYSKNTLIRSAINKSLRKSIIASPSEPPLS